MTKIQQYLRDRQSEMVELTKRIINIDSTPSNIEGVQQVAEILNAKMQELGMTTRQIDRGKPGTVLVGELAGEKGLAPVILDGHMDTVFPVGTVKQRPFKIAGDRMTGPGIFDMKPGLVIGLFAIQALKHFGLINRPIKIIMVSDEEKLHIDSNAYQIIADESQGGAYGLNLEGSVATDQVSTHNRGGMIIDVTVHGRAAHSGAEPEKGRSAILELAHQIIKLSALTDLKQGVHVNCGVINGGTSENIIPDQATTSLGVRFKTSAQRDRLLEEIHQITRDQTVPDTTTDVVIRTRIDSMEETPAVQRLFSDLNTAAQNLGMDKLVAGGGGGSSDAGILESHGVPSIDSLGPVGGGAHTAQEYASAQSLVDRAALIAELIRIKG